MTKTKSLVVRVRELVGHDDTYARDAFVKFAQAIYENGYNNGYSECSFDMGN